MFFKKKNSLSQEEKKQVNNEYSIPATRELMSAEFNKRLQHSADILENEIGSSGITLFSIGSLIETYRLLSNKGF